MVGYGGRMVGYGYGTGMVGEGNQGRDNGIKVGISGMVERLVWEVCQEQGKTNRPEGGARRNGGERAAWGGV